MEALSFRERMFKAKFGIVTVAVIAHCMHKTSVKSSKTSPFWQGNPFATLITEGLYQLLGKLYVTGGGESDSTHVDVVDVVSGETTSGPPMSHSRYWHAAAASPTSIFVFGGKAGTWFGGRMISSSEWLDPQTGQLVVLRFFVK